MKAYLVSRNGKKIRVIRAANKEAAESKARQKFGPNAEVKHIPTKREKLEKSLGPIPASHRPGIPVVKVSSATSKWRCPNCRRANDDGDSTCIHCGQDVDFKE